MDSIVKKKTVNGVIWSAIDRFSVQIVSLIVQIIIARILTPSDFGVVGMLTIFIAIAQTFVDSGFSNALIRKENRTETDNCTVFYFNLGVGLVSYLILFLIAPLVAKFYETPILKDLMRVVSLSVVFSSFSIVQTAVLTIHIDFKKQAFASLGSIILSGALGIFFAYKDFGPWALAIQHTSNTLFTAIFLWILVKWRPRLLYSWKSFREMFSFGSKLLASGLLDTLYNNMYALIIGKFYQAAELGYYTKANTFAKLPAFNITRILQRVTYPIMCQLRDDEKVYRNTFITYLKMSVFVVFPISLGLASISKPLVVILLTEKWLPAVVLLQTLCFYYMWHVVQAINLNILQVKGRSDIFFKLEVAKKVIGAIILIASIPLGVKLMCVGLIISSLIGTTLDIIFSGRFLKISLWDEVKIMMPSFLSSFLMFFISMFIAQFINNYYAQFFVILFSCMLIYLVAAFIFQRQELRQVLSLIHKK